MSVVQAGFGNEPSIWGAIHVKTIRAQWEKSAHLHHLLALGLYISIFYDNPLWAQAHTVHDRMHREPERVCAQKHAAHKAEKVAFIEKEMRNKSKLNSRQTWGSWLLHNFEASTSAWLGFVFEQCVCPCACLCNGTDVCVCEFLRLSALYACARFDNRKSLTRYWQQSSFLTVGVKMETATLKPQYWRTKNKHQLTGSIAFDYRCLLAVK